MRDTVQAQRHGGGGSDSTDAELPLRPQPQRTATGTDDQQHAQHVVDDLEARDHAHLPVHAGHEVSHRGSRVATLAVRVREELHGGDVRVGVGDAPGHRGSRIRLCLSHLDEPGYVVPHGQSVQHEPGGKRSQQPAAEVPCDDEDRDEVDDHVHEDVGQCEPGIAHGERRLHDLGCHPPGELVLVEAHALAEHPAVKIPAQAHREIAGQRLAPERALRRDHQRAAEQQARQREQGRAARVPQVGGIQFRQPVHDPAQRTEQQGLERADDRRAQRHQADVAAHSAGAVPQERHQALGEVRRNALRIGVD